MESNNKSSEENVEEDSGGKPDDCGDEEREVPSARLPTVVIRPYIRTGGIIYLCQYILIRIMYIVQYVLVCTPMIKGVPEKSITRKSKFSKSQFLMIRSSKFLRLPFTINHQCCGIETRI